MANRSYAVALDSTNLSALDAVRDVANLHVACDEGQVWVRTHVSNEDAMNALKAVAGDHYLLDQSGLLTPVGCQLATKKLPEDIHQSDWGPLGQWLVAHLPVPQWPASIGQRVVLELIPSDTVVRSSAVLTTIEELEDYVSDAPELAYRDLVFAMNQSHDAFVMGTVLPPVSGRRFWMAQNVAVPAGQCWSPSIDSECLQEVFDCGEDTVIWHATERWEALAADSLTPLTRAAARASKRVFS